MKHSVTQTSTGDKPLTVAQIRRVFRRFGYTQKEFARDYGCAESAVSQFFHGRSVSGPMYQSALAKAAELESQSQTTAA